MLRRYKFAVDGKAARVCKKFCIATLGIGIKTVHYVLKRKQDTDSLVKDRRGKLTHHNKTPEVDIERVRAHIDSFSAMESQYDRKQIQLNISEQQLFLMCNTCSTKCPVCHIVSNDWRLLQHISPAPPRRVIEGNVSENNKKWKRQFEMYLKVKYNKNIYSSFFVRIINLKKWKKKIIHRVSYYAHLNVDTFIKAEMIIALWFIDLCDVTREVNKESERK